MDASSSSSAAWCVAPCATSVGSTTGRNASSPEKVKPPELYLVLRRNGLRVLLCDANDADGPMAHSLREHLGDAHASARARTHVPRAKRASADGAPW